MGVKAVDFNQALALGDFFSLHTPLTPIPPPLFNAKAFAKMKKVSLAKEPIMDLSWAALHHAALCFIEAKLHSSSCIGICI